MVNGQYFPFGVLGIYSKIMTKRLLWVLGCFSLIGLIFSGFFIYSGVASAADVFYEVSSADSTSNAYGANSGTVTDLISQKYTAPSDQTLCTLYLRVSRLSYYIVNPSLVLRVRSGGSNPENGTQVASSSVPATSLPTNLTAGYTAFSLPSCITL